MAVSPGRAPARPKRPDIQGLRGIAVAFVVLFHAGLPFPGGFTGVDVFFAISGFVITSSLVAELEREGRLSLTRFYARRVRRLLPALATMIVVVTALGTLATPVGAMHITALTGLFASTFGANVYLSALPQGYFGASTTLDPFLHTWTLAVEEQFYVVVPALLLGAWLLGRSRLLRGASRLTALVALAALTAASFELAVETLSEPAAAVTFADRFGFYGAPARAWEFGAGALLALVFPLLRRVPAFAATGAGTCGLAAVCFAGFAIHGQASFSAWEALLPVGGACLLMAAGAAPENMCSALLAVRPLTWIGDRSYSWYLWHWPLIVFARGLAPGSGWVAPVAAAVSLVPASLSYRYVENPIRHHPRIRGRAVVALAGACVAVGLAGSLALLGADRVLSATTTLGSFTARTKDHLDEAHQCHGPVVVELAGRRACTWTVPRSRGAVVLIGDSNAGHFAEPVVRAANRDGFDAIVATYYSCPFADLLISGSVAGLTIDEGACRSFDRRSIAAIARLRPSLVIVGARVDLRLEDRHEALRGPGAARATTAPAQKAALYTAGLRRYLLRLHRAGVPVLLVDPVPRIVGSRADPNTCAVLLVIAEACRGRVGRAQATRALRGARTVHRRAAQGIAGVATVDFEADLCEPSYCASDARGRNIYRDTGHLSVTGALALTDRFAALIRANARPGRRT